MNSLLNRIAAHTLRTGMVRRSDIDRLRQYASRHPMWEITATPQMIAAYNALVANGG